jgi:hypothetical protein
MYEMRASDVDVTTAVILRCSPHLAASLEG